MRMHKIGFIFLVIGCLVGFLSQDVFAKEPTPTKLKNPRLNALLTPMSRTATYMRVTPTSIISYDRRGKSITDIEKNCDLIKNEETVAILRCPFDGKNFKKSFVFHWFVNQEPTSDFDIGRCKINYDSELTREKDFDIESREGGITILYSTAPGCKTSRKEPR